jgi:hypothetical protein
MRWITRERPKIDRVACPWLISRFIDPEAEFIFVPPTEVVEKAKELDAVPYDVHGVELTHYGELCSFDAFLKKYNLDEPELRLNPDLTNAPKRGSVGNSKLHSICLRSSIDWYHLSALFNEAGWPRFGCPYSFLG